jgi:predicted ATP-grasp superfamily ATP-dependent carboligase
MTAVIAAPTTPAGITEPVVHESNSVRTVTTVAALLATLPIDLALVTLALVWGRTSGGSSESSGRTILVNGGKMTKALQLARSFHAAGHRVVLVESAKYRLTGHRFSRSVDAFYCIPEASEPGYAEALLDIVTREGVDVFVPVSSPVASLHDAQARELLDDVCEVVHADADTVTVLDDKAEFSNLAEDLGLRVPDWRLITDPRQVVDFDFPEGRSYILKRIAYNPVGRLDLTRLSRETPERNAAFAHSLAITDDDPWILQEFISGQEYCTHGTVRRGELQVYGCCESSASQLNYAMVDKPEIRSWVEKFVRALDITGQVSFDFIEAHDGEVYAIECNPRTHSAITMFHDHPAVAAAYLDDGHPLITPRPQARPTYWIYHEMWRLITQRGRRGARLRTILSGKDAIFSWRDPLPYLMVHHLQIPALLIDNLRRRRGWTKIDFNIGKLVEVGGD